MPMLIDGTAPTEAEFVTLQYQLWRRQRRTRFLSLGLALGVLLLLTSVGLDVYRQGRLTDYGPAVFLLVAGAYALARGPLVRQQLRRYYARTPALASPTRFELEPDGFRGQGRLSSVESRWGGLLKAHRLGPWLLLYITEATCYYLDLRRLQPPATPAEVLALLWAQGVTVQEG